MNKVIKRISLVAFLVISLLALVGCGSERTVGIVDMDKIIRNSGQAKVIQKQIEEKQEEIIQRLETESQELSEEEMQKKEMEAHQEMQAYANAMQKQFVNIVETQAQFIAQEKELSIIMLKHAIHNGGIDVTDDLMEKLK